MTARGRAIIELVFAVAAAVGCVVSWLSAQSTEPVAPILEGERWTTSQVYSPPLVALSLLLAALGGALIVVAVARLRRARSVPADSAAEGPATDRV